MDYKKIEKTIENYPKLEDKHNDATKLGIVCGVTYYFSQHII